MRFYLEYWVNVKGILHNQIINYLLEEAAEILKACTVTVTEEELQHEILSLFKLLEKRILL